MAAGIAGEGINVGLIRLGQDAILLVVRHQDRIYLFPPAVLSVAAHLLRADIAGLAAAGAGVDITWLTDPNGTARLDQILALYRDTH
jgi:hypothetical protein